MPRSYLLLLSYAFILCAPCASVAQETILPHSTDLTLSGTATYLAETKEYRLTSDNYWQEGRVDTKSICAKEFKVSYDVFVGDRNANLNGGAGVIFYELNANTKDWMNVVELNIQDRARVANYNSLELVRFGNGPAVFTTVPVPFMMGGAGYMHVEYTMNEGVTNALLTSDLGSVSVAGKGDYAPSTPLQFRFFAWTGTARNLQKIKNIEIDIIRPDNCSGQPSLSLEQTKEQVSAACGSDACSAFETFFSCASELLDEFKASGIIDLAIHSSVLAEHENKMNYCLGKGECEADRTTIEKTAFEKGFNAGVLSIDQNALKSEAFAKGVQSIDVEAIKAAAYKDGLDVGVASVDVATIELRAFNAGFSAGVSSVNVEDVQSAAREEGFSAGVASIDVESIRAETYQQAYAAGVASVDIESARTGGYQDGLAAGREAGYEEGYSKGLAVEKVTLCHRQPKKQPVTVTVSRKALKAHLAHGDSLGACPASGTNHGRS